MNLEDFTNEVKGINDNFISKTDTYKKVEQKFSIDPNIFEAFFEIFLNLDVKKAAEADKNKEIYAAIVYDLTKIFYAASN
jgi:hypothetical protein